jgi:glutamate-5-semialdehyde dehydrogenase
MSTATSTPAAGSTGIGETMRVIGRNARAAALLLAGAPRDAKDAALRAAAQELRRNAAAIIEANARDVAAERPRDGARAGAPGRRRHHL